MDYGRRIASSRISGCSKLSDLDTERHRLTQTTLSCASCSRPSYASSGVDAEKRRITLTTLSSGTYNILQSQWEILMRKFSKDCKIDDNCKSYSDIRSQEEKLMRKILAERTKKLVSIQTTDHEAITCESRPLKKFTTGSTYEGTWDAIGICGFGTYTFPNGVVYQGEFEDNMFHGDGEMRYPDGTVLRGKWNYGEMIDRTIIFPDGVHYKEHNWEYCKQPDRRYSQEYKDGIQPGGKSFITKDGILRDIPEGSYDVGDGYFDPKFGNTFDYDDPTNNRVVSANLKSWIEENCRKAPDVSVGPQPELYKEWREVTLEATKPPPPCCLSETESDNNDFYSEHTFDSVSSMSRSRTSGTSWGKKLKFDQEPKPMQSIYTYQHHWMPRTDDNTGDEELQVTAQQSKEENCR